MSNEQLQTLFASLTSDPIAQMLMAEKIETAKDLSPPRPVKRIETLTDALVDEYANMPSTRGERSFKPSKAKNLEAVYKQGRFKGADFAHILVKDSGRKVRANGQHSSRMLQGYRKANPTEPLLPLEATIEEWVVEDEAGLARWATYIFGTYDTPKAVRSDSDSIAAYVKNHPTAGEHFMGVRADVLRALAGGLNRFYTPHPKKGVKSVVRSMLEKAGLVIEHEDFSLVFAPLLEDQKFRMQAVVSAMYSSYCENKGFNGVNALNFWKEVVTPSVSRHPESDKLRTSLLKTTSSSSSKNDANRVEAICRRHWKIYLGAI